MTPLEAFLKEKGFDDEKEFHHLVSNVDLTNPVICKKFLEWKSRDGTKQGLIDISKEE